MLFSNFSSSPVEKLAEKIHFAGFGAPSSFIGDAVFKGVQFSILWGLAMWALQWSYTGLSFQAAIVTSIVVGMATGVWMAAINRRSKQSTGLHRVGYQPSQAH
ncbi:DUF6404 family protein [Rhodanobacter aciditrophus]|uniref:DUF6404 family protein n=1 Tax=Rhodanobacter aciditrophus TaxID=1623218 RepID=A0ABW4B2R1_9GAMM